MAIEITSAYGPLKVGTINDDGRLATENLFIEIPITIELPRYVLTQAQALDLAMALLRTIKDMQYGD